MKGAIVNCLHELVNEKYGNQKWEEMLEKAGMDRDSFFLAMDDIDDSAAIKVVQTACNVLGVSLSELADEFGDYWVNTYAAKYYKVYYIGVKSAREFLLKMNDVHQMVTKDLPNAHPPRFEYVSNSENKLIMKYISQRGLIDFMIGLIKGVGHYYKENLTIRQLPGSQVEITFS